MSEPKAKIVFFNMKEGCGFCEKMRPIVAEYAKKHPDVEVEDVKLASYNEVPDPFPKAVPLFVAYLDDKVVSVQEGVISAELLELAFQPDKIPPKVIPVERASTLQLMQDEANLMDQVYPLQTQLTKIRAEIQKRRDATKGKEACCDGCASGKGCSGGGKSCGGGGH